MPPAERRVDVVAVERVLALKDLLILLNQGIAREVCVRRPIALPLVRSQPWIDGWRTQCEHRVDRRQNIDLACVQCPSVARRLRAADLDATAADRNAGDDRNRTRRLRQ